MNNSSNIVTTPAKVRSDLSLQTRDRYWALLAAIGIVTITLVPYLIGYSLSNGRQFMWLGYNLDDSCVYLSWMRQAREGAFLGYNLFTTDPQHGMALNPLFLVMGNVARLTGLPLLAVYHGARLLFGLGLLLLTWRLIEVMTPDRFSRKLAFLFVGLAAGLGWLPFWWQESSFNTPVDRWQPEAITFLSLLLSPLFCFALALQVAIILLLFTAERTRQLRPALIAGVCGCVLGLVHTYDVLSLAAVWLTYLIVNTFRPAPGSDKASVRIAWRNALAAGTITLPGVLYIYFQLRTETVFKQRAAVPTWSPPIAWVLLGYGFTLVLALFTVYRMTKSHQSSSPKDSSMVESGAMDSSKTASDAPIPIPVDAARLLVAWAVANLLISYIPTTFQRKLLQGEHFPIAILAGVGAAWLLCRMRLQGWKLWSAAALVTLFLSITNIRFMLREIENYEANLAQTGQQRTFLKPGEIEALHWIDANVPRNVAVQPLPYLVRITDSSGNTQKVGATDMSIACFTPGLTDHHVYCGHWGETPDYGHKLGELTDFALPKTTDVARIALLKKMRVGYILYSQKDTGDDSADYLAPMFRERVPVPAYLKRVYTNSDADVYQVDATLLAARVDPQR